MLIAHPNMGGSYLINGVWNRTKRGKFSLFWFSLVLELVLGPSSSDWDYNILGPWLIHPHYQS